MNHRTLEKELTHLEYVIARISITDALPLVYWRGRVAALVGVATLPNQRARVKKLGDALLALTQTSAAIRAPQATPARQTRRAAGGFVPADYDFDQYQTVD